MGRQPDQQSRRKTDELDRRIGERVRQCRLLVGMSQEKLGEALGITFQQVQKYEKGANRISASRLRQIASILQTSVTQFYDAEDGEPSTPRQDLSYGVRGLRVARALARIEDRSLQQQLIALVEAVAERLSPPR